MNHKDLKAWQVSVSLAVEIYAMTKTFPSEEKFGLTSQMRRAAVSIPSNIAEGAARRGSKEFLQFLYIAAGSANELSTQSLISEKIGLLTGHAVEKNNAQIERVLKLIHGLIKSVKKREELGTREP